MSFDYFFGFCQTAGPTRTAPCNACDVQNVSVCPSIDLEDKMLRTHHMLRAEEAQMAYSSNVVCARDMYSRVTAASPQSSLISKASFSKTYATKEISIDNYACKKIKSQLIRERTEPVRHCKILGRTNYSFLLERRISFRKALAKLLAQVPVREYSTLNH
jgi:hypothetical protein